MITRFRYILNVAMALPMAGLLWCAVPAQAADNRAAHLVQVQDPSGKPQITVDALSVVRVRAQASANARSGRTLGRNREGTGVVIDSSGLVLTIGYLITEAEKVELTTAMARSIRRRWLVLTMPPDSAC